MPLGRRRFLIGAALSSVSLEAWSQARPRMPRIGIVLNSAPPNTGEWEQSLQPMRAFMQELRRLGYVEGRNCVIERRTAEGNLDRLESLLADLARLPVDVIAVSGNQATMAAKRATTSIPIVVAGMSTPVELGFISSFSRPGGNVTGLSPTFGPEAEIKRLELIRQVLPKARRVAYLGVKTSWDQNLELRDAAAKMGLSLEFVDARLPNIGEGLAHLPRSRPDALFVPPLSPLYVYSKAIADFATKNGVPDFHGHLIAAQAGALAAYGHDANEIWSRAAGYVVRILKGAKPAELPVEQMNRYQLIVNLKTAKALGIAVPNAVIQRADHVIQ